MQAALGVAVICSGGTLVALAAGLHDGISVPAQILLLVVALIMISVGLGIRAYAAEDIRRSYEALILRRLVPTINPRLRFLGGGFSPLTLRRSRLFAAFDSTKGMKLISGDWPDFELDLAEVRTFKTRYREVADTQVSSDVLSWQGLFARVRLRQPATGMLLVLPASEARKLRHAARRLARRIGLGGYEAIELGDEAFHRSYVVFARSAAFVRSVLSPVLVAKLMDHTQRCGGLLRVSLSGQALDVALPVRGPFLEAKGNALRSTMRAVDQLIGVLVLLFDLAKAASTAQNDSV